MAISTRLLPLAVGLVAAAVVVAVKADLEATCKAAAYSKEYTIGYAFCMTSLQADPGSATADAPGLAAIAVRLSSAHTKSTQDQIDSLLKGASGAEKTALESCAGIYTRLFSEFGSTAMALELKSYKDAALNLDDARRQPSFCDNRFKGAVENPLVKDNSYLSQMATLALQIVTTLD